MEDLLGLVNADNLFKLILVGIVYKSLRQDLSVVGERLQQSIEGLNMAVNRLTDKLEVLQQSYNGLSVQVAKMEESLAAAHKRITEHIEKG